MGGTESTRRVDVTAENYDDDGGMIPRTPQGSHVAAKRVQGSHVLEISGYSLHQERLRDCDDGHIKSAVFAVGGYDWQIIFFPGGVDDRFKDYAAAYLVLKSEDDIRVRASFELSLVDVTGSTPPHTIAGTHEFGPDKCCGYHDFKKRSELELEGSPYLHDDRLTIECLITIVKDAKKSPSSLPKLPACASDITDHLGKLLREKENADVTFVVGGEDFPAHKTVLAMRSPVFKAELYGAMSEKDMDRITIHDMQPAVFEALLQFIYTDSLPAMEDLAPDDYSDLIWHLLAAADRYAVEKLKVVCEGILCESIDVKTVMTTLALADRHRCGSLHDACVQFIASLNRMQVDDVVASQGYAELKANCPLVLAELWEKTRRVGRSKSKFDIGSLVA